MRKSLDNGVCFLLQQPLNNTEHKIHEVKVKNETSIIARLFAWVKKLDTQSPRVK